MVSTRCSAAALAGRESRRREFIVRSALRLAGRRMAALGQWHGYAIPLQCVRSVVNRRTFQVAESIVNGARMLLCGRICFEKSS